MALFSHKQYSYALMLTTLLVWSCCTLGAAQRQSGDAATHQQLGHGFLVSQQFDRAISELREALRLDPDAPETHNDLGLAWIGKGDLNTACEEFREAVRLSPRSAEARSNLGFALLKKGNREA